MELTFNTVYLFLQNCINLFRSKKKKISLIDILILSSSISLGFLHYNFKNLNL